MRLSGWLRRSRRSLLFLVWFADGAQFLDTCTNRVCVCSGCTGVLLFDYEPIFSLLFILWLYGIVWSAGALCGDICAIMRVFGCTGVVASKIADFQRLSGGVELHLSGVDLLLPGVLLLNLQSLQLHFHSLCSVGPDCCLYPQHEHISRVSFLVCLSVFACTPAHSNSPTTSTDSLACFAGALTKQLSDSCVS